MVKYQFAALISFKWRKKYQIFEDDDSAELLVSRVFNEGDSFGLHGVVVSLEVVSLKEETHATTSLKFNGFYINKIWNIVCLTNKEQKWLKGSQISIKSRRW